MRKKTLALVPAGAALLVASVTVAARAADPHGGSPASTAHAAKVAAKATSKVPTRRLCDKPTKVGMMACLVLMRTDIAPMMKATAAAAPRGVSPADLQAAYK